MNKSKKLKSSKSPLRKRILIAVISLMTLGALYYAYIHYADYQKFMTLRQDMRALQAEFNKIDAGWEYEEYCRARGEKFKEHEASSCGIVIKNLKVLSVDPYFNSLPDKYRIERDSSFTGNDGIYQNNREITYAPNSTINCGIGGYKKSEGYYTVGMSCSDWAKNFYFPKVP